MDWPETGPYQRDLLAGAHRAAVEHQANLLVLPASVFHSEFRAFPDWSLGEGGSRPLDALVLATATFLGTQGPSWLEERLRPWRHLPMVSIGETLSGMPSIQLDDGDSFALLLDHLFGHHQYRNPVFVTGPLASFDARVRLQVFRQALVRHGIPDSDDRLIPGDYLFTSGKMAAKTLASRPGPRPDVVICSNDNMAFGVLYEFVSQGIRVPQDVAVTGFDDGEFSPWMVSPLTTVHQPIFEIAGRAVELVLGRPSENSTVFVPTTTVIRSSCGCPTTPSTDPVLDHLTNQLSQYYQIDASLRLEGHLAQFSLDLQDSDGFGALVKAEVGILEALGMDWWYLCHGQPGEEVFRPQRLHVVGLSGTLFDGPVQDTETGHLATFPQHLDLAGRWTALQMDVTDGPRGRQFGVLIMEYRQRFQGRYEVLRTRLSEAVAAMLTTQRLKHLNEALQEAGRKLEELSLTDELTGCYNRRGFLTLGTRELATCRRQGQGLWVFFLDLDGLKTINDRWGHEAGDQAIRDFAQVVAHSIRSTDLLARLGGDEFIILAAHSDESAQGVFRERLDRQLVAYHGRSPEPWGLAYSLGGVYSTPADVGSLTDLIAHADGRLYEEKQHKRRRSE